MNLESLWIGQNLSCRCTAGKVGLIWPPGADFNSVGLTRGLSVTGPGGAIPLLCCTKFGLLGAKFGPTALGLLGGRFGLSALGLLGGRFGLSALGLLKGRFGPTCCTLGFTT